MPLRVEAGDAPQAVLVLRAQILHCGSLFWGEDLKMRCFVDVFFNHAEVVDSFHEEQFLNRRKSTLSLE